MPRYYIHNDKRGFRFVSRRGTLNAAVQEWIAQAVREEFTKSVIYIEDTWDYDTSDSGGGTIVIDEISLPFEWEITEEPMKLTITQLTKPIDVYVVILDFYSESDHRLIGSEPITCAFSEKLAMDLRGKDRANEKWRVQKISTTGVMGLQQVIDRLTDGG